MSRPAERIEKTKLSAQDWVEAALDLIGEAGIHEVAVESLARRLGVTKGSFYWHFSNREALIDAALAHWEAEDIRTFERSIGLIHDPGDKLRSLFRRSREETRSHVLFSALFKAADHPQVWPIMQRVSERRLSFLRDGFRELGMTAADAANRARLTYLSYVGFLQYYQQFREARMSSRELESYVEHVIDTLIPERAEAGGPVAD